MQPYSIMCIVFIIEINTGKKLIVQISKTEIALSKNRDR